MSRKTLIQSIQPDPQGPVYGRVSDPVEFMNSQKYAHEHIEAISRDLLMAGAANPLVAGFGLTLDNALDIIITGGHAVKSDGLSYETLPPGNNINISLDAAHPSLPRIDLIYAVLETEADAEIEFRPYVRLRTQLELEQGVNQYAPEQFNQATEKHNKATVLFKKGIPAANPVAPVTNTNEASLYEIRVEAGAVNLTNDKVTDVRNLIISLFELINSIEGLDGTLQPLSEKNQLNGYAGLDSGGKIDVSQIPALKSHEFVVVANQTARLALTAAQVQLGDEAFQTDSGETYKLISADPSQGASWKIISDTTPDWSAITNKPATFASTIALVSGLQPALDALQPLSQKNQVNGYAGLDSGGKLDVNQIPALKSHEFVVVANQPARLALTPAQVQLGDEAFETDTGINYKLISADPSQITSWKAISGTAANWASITNKPLSFPSSIPEVTGLQSALDGKLNVLPTLIQMGGVTNLYPAIKRDGSGVQIRSADDSGFASLRTGIFKHKAWQYFATVSTVNLTSADSGVYVTGHDLTINMPEFEADLLFHFTCISPVSNPFTIKFPAGLNIRGEPIGSIVTAANSFFTLHSGSAVFISTYNGIWIICEVSGVLTYTA